MLWGEAGVVDPYGVAMSDGLVAMKVQCCFQKGRS